MSSHCSRRDLKPIGNEEPTLDILMLLGAHLGIPYLAVASTAPLLQRWFSYYDHSRFPNPPLCAVKSWIVARTIGVPCHG